ncbi:hypothetical protein N8I77_000312 [Diaporthe amygdali]|uniref:Protein kinase domain-containing protein n=1 Tax=Phomopsis amygdali TaxID=1214568 RepID=A0AAD9SPH2_PHOAM|nr:hypothetical protein N8I77_000312 [Diaporthe amygdali]
MDVVGIFGDHDEYEGAQVTFRLEKTGERIVVSLFRSETTETSDEESRSLPLVDKLIMLLGQSLVTDDDDEQQILMDEAVDPIYQAAEAIISEFESTAANSTNEHQPSQGSSLHAILYPKASHYRLQSTTRLNGPVLIPIAPSEEYCISFDDGRALLENQAQIQADCSLLRYSTHQIRVIEEFLWGDGTVCLVTVDAQNQTFLCKAMRDGLRNSSLVREIDCLQRISQASPGLANRRTALQVPALKGYVEYPENGVILGVLREWIPSKYKLRDLEKTTSQDLDAPQELREKWAGQIRETIQTLHTMGVVWGDAKPSNIIIDLNDDAWIIDFGGSWTDGWVDEDLQETIEGDEQGVARILKLLDVDA